MHRLISTSLILKDADGRALAVASIKPIVTHKPLCILNDWHEFLAYPAVNLCTVPWIKVIMTNDGEHDASPWFNVPISTLFWDDSVRRLSCQARIGDASRGSVCQGQLNLRWPFPNPWQVAPQSLGSPSLPARLSVLARRRYGRECGVARARGVGLGLGGGGVPPGHSVSSIEVSGMLSTS